MTTLKRAFELLISRTKRSNCFFPSIVRLGSLIVSRHAWETGWLSPVDGNTAPNTLRVDCGRVGARSGRPVLGLLQTPSFDALAERNERSSRKKVSRLPPQRRVL